MVNGQPLLHKTVELKRTLSTKIQTWKRGTEAFFVGVQDGDRLALYFNGWLAIANAKILDVEIVND